MTDERSIPTGRLGRLARLARVGAETGASMLLHKGGDRAAAHAAEVLGTLRGLAAKMGQTLSYVDGLVPESQRELYERTLGALRAGAPRSSATEIRDLVESELRAPLDALFAEWEDTPFASASIGQVHRARLADGRQVAVKVQHPKIAEAIESDLKNAEVLKGIAGLIAPRGMNADEIFDVVRSRFREELDYCLEAERQRAFADLHAGNADIKIPEVILARSSRRVLTSMLVQGDDLDVAARADATLRGRYARTLWRFVFRGNLVGGMFNADPHPGNYLFHSDGSITFLDFGCVQPIDPLHQARALGMHWAAVDRDEARFRSHAAALLGTRGGSYERASIGYSRRCFEPLFASPFCITRGYVRDLVTSIQKLKGEMWAKDKSFVPLPSSLVFMNRLQFGFYSVLSRLDVEVDYAAVEREFLPSRSAA
jgi:predicted unusual protein kinase regulating ubiquinone biosynthesis (AarF/ABC1/UbiB family)